MHFGVSECIFDVLECILDCLNAFCHRYHTVFLPSDVFRLILSQMRKNKKKNRR